MRFSANMITKITTENFSICLLCETDNSDSIRLTSISKLIYMYSSFAIGFGRGGFVRHSFCRSLCPLWCHIISVYPSSYLCVDNGRLTLIGILTFSASAHVAYGVRISINI